MTNFILAIFLFFIFFHITPCIFLYHFLSIWTWNISCIILFQRNTHPFLAPSFAICFLLVLSLLFCGSARLQMICFMCAFPCSFGCFLKCSLWFCFWWSLRLGSFWVLLVNSLHIIILIMELSKKGCKSKIYFCQSKTVPRV